MTLACALALVCQFLEPDPAQAEVGAAVSVAVFDRAGAAVSGVTVEVRRPDGRTERIGETGPDGSVEFVAPLPGSYRLQANRDGVVLVAPFHAYEPPRRWLWALWCVPVGLVLAWLNLIGLRHDRRRARGG